MSGKFILGLISESGRIKWINKALILSIPILIIGRDIESGVISPKDGGPFPRAVQNLLNNNRELFTLEHRWADRKIAEVRSGSWKKAELLSGSIAGDRSGGILAGDLNIPVLMGLYNNIQEPLADSLLLARELFDGPWQTGTLSDYFTEVSSSLLNVSGRVYGWVPLPGSEIYYTGGDGYWGLDLTYSRTDEMISQTVLGVDEYVDFGLYDNDGPDGIPNSGDDDGYVDILIIVTPTRGAECSWLSAHMWSHSARFSLWNEDGEPLSTNDLSASGGNILIDDYIIGPTVSCASDRLIEIGLFCHELGHALGLKDLYDTGFYGVGIGDWGIMGHGAWNTPESPAHPCAWSKVQLGWVNIIDVGWREQTIRLEPIAISGEVVRLTLPDARFKRRFCIQGQSNYSLLCACDEEEAEARGWPDETGPGYGNAWTESMAREFSYDNSSPCSLFYSVTADLEEGCDFGYLLLEAGGIDTIAVYTGRITPVDETIILSDYLPAAKSVFTLRFLFLSDFENSDEDRGYDSDGCRVFSIDDIAVRGGGIDYFSDFESDAGGWREDTLSSEYFLVAYRDRRGFDKNLPGEGLLVWHAENAIAYSALKNSGGNSNTQARGVVLEEADGNYDLLFDGGFGNSNYGDAGDPFPGITGSTSFTSETTPNSRSNGGAVTPVNIRGIRFGYQYIEAVFSAGNPEPLISYVTPDTIIKSENGNLICLDICGENLLPSAECFLTDNVGEVAANDISWFGENRIIAEFNPEELYAGYWSLNLKNADGQSVLLPDAVFVNSIYSYAYTRINYCFIDIDWKLEGSTPFRSLVYRKLCNDDNYALVTPDTLFGTDSVFHFRDTEVDPDRDYSYKIVSFSGSVIESIVFPGPYRIENIPLTQFQNYPNPFTTGTTIQFYLPRAIKAKILFFDVSGRKIDGIEERFYPAGYNTVNYQADAELFVSGVYFCVLDTGGRQKAIKIVILR